MRAGTSCLIPFFDVKNSAAAPFQSFKLKRHSETGGYYDAKGFPDGKFIAYTDKKNSMWLKNTATGGNVKILPESVKFAVGVRHISPDDDHDLFWKEFQNQRERY